MTGTSGGRVGEAVDTGVGFAVLVVVVGDGVAAIVGVGVGLGVGLPPTSGVEVGDSVGD